MSGWLRVALGLAGLFLAGWAADAGRPPIGTFNLSFRQLEAEAQVALVEKVGYDGLMVGTWEDHRRGRAKLPEPTGVD